MKEKDLWKILLVGLPAGLAVALVGAVILYAGKHGGGRRESVSESAMKIDVNENDLARCVKVLGTTIGERNTAHYEALDRTRKFLESSLGRTNMGYRVRRQTFEAGGRECSNVEVELPGGKRRDEIVVVGAHYDTAPGSPGANDNGTGVAGVLALANAFVGSKNERTLRFVLFVNEEPPWHMSPLMGSLVYAKRCGRAGEKVVAMISLETMGCFSDEPGSQHYPPGLAERYPDKGNFIAVVGNLQSKALVDDVAARFREAGGFPVESGAFPADLPGVGWSDHWSFWQAGYPAVMITDTAPFRYAHYHKPTDTPDKVDTAKLTEVVKGMEAVIRGLANPGAPRRD